MGKTDKMTKLVLFSRVCVGVSKLTHTQPTNPTKKMSMTADTRAAKLRSSILAPREGVSGAVDEEDLPSPTSRYTPGNLEHRALEERDELLENIVCV